MIASTLLVLAAASRLVAAAPASAPRSLGFDQRGLSRLRNSTLAGRALMPGPFHGVNLGSWFVYEPYMAIDEWHNMVGQACS